MQEYKGIYYGETNEQHFYEGGAHFKYIELYRRLEILYRQQVLINPIKRVNFIYYYSKIKQEMKIQIIFKVKLEIIHLILILL